MAKHDPSGHRCNVMHDQRSLRSANAPRCNGYTTLVTRRYRPRMDAEPHARHPANAVLLVVTEATERFHIGCCASSTIRFVDDRLCSCVMRSQLESTAAIRENHTHHRSGAAEFRRAYSIFTSCISSASLPPSHRRDRQDSDIKSAFLFLSARAPRSPSKNDPRVVREPRANSIAKQEKHEHALRANARREAAARMRLIRRIGVTPTSTKHFQRTTITPSAPTLCGPADPSNNGV
jgi:hypothetical protein